MVFRDGHIYFLTAESDAGDALSICVTAFRIPYFLQLAYLNVAPSESIKKIILMIEDSPDPVTFP